MSERRGSIVALDGPDGSGKTTQLELLAQDLRAAGHDVYTTRASGGTPIGEALRAVSLSDHPRSAEVDVCISLAMHTALGQDIQARRAEGQTVLVDRSPLAIIAYNVFGSQLADEQLGYDACERMLRLWGIDCLIVFEATQKVLDARRRSRTDKPTDYFERQPGDYARRVQAGYRVGLDFAHNLPDLPITIATCDADRSIADMYRQLQQYVQPFVG